MKIMIKIIMMIIKNFIHRFKKKTIYRFKNMNIEIYTLLYILLVYERELS